MRNQHPVRDEAGHAVWTGSLRGYGMYVRLLAQISVYDYSTVCVLACVYDCVVFHFQIFSQESLLHTYTPKHIGTLSQALSRWRGENESVLLLLVSRISIETTLIAHDAILCAFSPPTIGSDSKLAFFPFPHTEAKSFVDLGLILLLPLASDRLCYDEEIIQ